MFRTEWSSERPPSLAVVEAVATVTDSEPTKLPLLNDAINTDALDTLFVPEADDQLRVSFVYDGLDITVDGEGSVTVSPVE
ncbi:hypothetical protein GJ631_06740 [Natronomonas sp. CBA1123]|jgi:hypothetical protein|nr:hypothetical protein [Natronomonas sp. CBA1123]